MAADGCIGDPMITPDKIKCIDNGDGTWTVTLDGVKAATITIAPMGMSADKGVSIDVHPAGPSKVDAIAFGAKPIFEPEPGARVDRFTLGQRTGNVAPEYEPFVCVAIYPNKGSAK